MIISIAWGHGIMGKPFPYSLYIVHWTLIYLTDILFKREAVLNVNTLRDLCVFSIWLIGSVIWSFQIKVFLYVIPHPVLPAWHLRVVKHLGKVCPVSHADSQCQKCFRSIK